MYGYLRHHLLLLDYRKQKTRVLHCTHTQTHQYLHAPYRTNCQTSWCISIICVCFIIISNHYATTHPKKRKQEQRNEKKKTLVFPPSFYRNIWFILNSTPSFHDTQKRKFLLFLCLAFLDEGCYYANEGASSPLQELVATTMMRAWCEHDGLRACSLLASLLAINSELVSLSWATLKFWY